MRLSPVQANQEQTAARKRAAVLALFMILLASFPTAGAAGNPPPTPADRALAAYFAAETAALEQGCLADIRSREDWEANRPAYRRQLQEMLGLAPWPERGDLRAVVTGQLEHDQFRVEKLHFQSLPGLYVTANLYLPKVVSGKLPAILYVCGHGRVVTNGVSCGNKTAYQHHGAWFARHGYVCLTIDTVQLGEIEGLHHGTYRQGLWWWNSRGYTPAGVEAWNGIRALDYLASRPEVDAERLGLTGRSGGGAYSWTVAALDDRVKVVAPIAGITDLQNHVVDGVVDGHCDCMFFVNTYRWDYPLLAALIAPRPLLLGNSDKDPIFPLEGVLRVHQKVRRIYQLHNATAKLGLLITEGPHQDTQDLQVPVFRWFNRWLKNDETLVQAAAEKFFPVQDLRVFPELPTQNVNSNIHEQFVRRGDSMPVGLDDAGRARWRADRLVELKTKSFAGWPAAPGPLNLQPVIDTERDGLRFRAWDFASQPGVALRLYALTPVPEGASAQATLHILSASEWTTWLAAMRTRFDAELGEERAAAGTNLLAPDPEAFHRQTLALATDKAPRLWLAPRGIGLTAWSGGAPREAQIRRRFMLLGQTLDGMRVWDIRRAVAAARTLPPVGDRRLVLQAAGSMAVNALYAGLFEPDLPRLALEQFPASHRDGPDYLNVLQVWDLPDALGTLGDRRSPAGD